MYWIGYSVLGLIGTLLVAIAYLLGWRDGYDAGTDYRRIRPRVRGE